MDGWDLVGPPEVSGLSVDNLFSHMVDYPELFRKAIKVKFETDMNKLETSREMGFDLLFAQKAKTFPKRIAGRKSYA